MLAAQALYGAMKSQGKASRVLPVAHAPVVLKPFTGASKLVNCMLGVGR